MTESHVPGHTTATASRAVRDFTAPLHVHDLELEVNGLIAEALANASHRAARTLSKDAALNAVLMAIRGGTEVVDHRAHGSAILQVLRGTLRIHVQDNDMELRAGQAVSFASGVPHRLSAIEDTALLLVIAAP